MRKRYSRSYTVLSFLTMFSYRELPFAASFFKYRIDKDFSLYYTICISKKAEMGTSKRSAKAKRGSGWCKLSCGAAQVLPEFCG